MDLTITATVTLLEAKSDLDAVAERMAAFNNGWYGGVTFTQGDDGPIWRIKVYREGYPPIDAGLGNVLVTDSSFVTRYPSVAEYNSAHPDSPIS